VVAASRRAGWAGSLLRWLQRLGLAGLGITALLLAAGATYQQVATWRDARSHPPNGRLVDVDGHAMHIKCDGTGPVTVVLESALGGTWMDWALVQPEVATFSRVCSYDRAGMGWSQPGPRPRTSERIAAELEALLAAAGERPPYVLVGHSIGGYHVRVFATRRPREVAGLVLVEAAHEEMLARLPPEVTRQLDGLAAQLRWLRYGMYVGLPRLRGLCGQAPAGLERLQGEQTFNQCRVSFVRTLEQELAAVSEDAAEVAATGGLGDRPLIVVERDFGSPDPDLPPQVAEKATAVGRELQQELSRLSTAGRLVVAQGSGHYVQLDRPDVVVRAIRELVKELSH